MEGTTPDLPPVDQTPSTLRVPSTLLLTITGHYVFFYL